MYKILKTLLITGPLITGILLWGSYGSVAHSDEKARLADGLYNYVMERYPEYATLPEPKVLAACIEWDRATQPPIFIHNVLVTYTDPGTDAQIFIGELKRDALLRCKRWASSENVDCTCQILDMNGKNALRIP
jgi:hypothetical protein